MRRLIAGQYWLVLVTVCLFITTAVAIVGSVFGNWRFGLPTGDKTVIVNTVVATGAYVLVSLTLIVALAAYVSANGRPDLSPVIEFKRSSPNRPIFLVASNSGQLPPLRPIEESRQTEGEVVISNSSKYAARNPGVRIELQGLGGMAPQPGWTTIAQEKKTGVSELQWDGGADYIIHGRWSRALPMLNVKGVFAYQDDPAFIIAIAADGFAPKLTRIPVEILDEEEYGKVQH
jgi:hypothetical protein